MLAWVRSLNSTVPGSISRMLQKYAGFFENARPGTHHMVSQFRCVQREPSLRCNGVPSKTGRCRLFPP